MSCCWQSIQKDCIENYLSPDDYGELDKVYTEDYRQIDLIEALKDIQNHQIRFNPNHRDGIYNI
jgi:hypothetical protein